MTRPRGDAGISLVELLVAMALTSILLVVLGSVFVSSSRTVSREAAASRNTETASLALRELSRVLRAGSSLPTADGPALPAFAAAGPRSVTVHSWLDTAPDTNPSAPRPVAVRFEAAADGTLGQTRWSSETTSPGTFSFAPAPSSTRVIARGVGAGAVFRFHDAAGVEIVATATDGQLDAAQRGRIASVDISLTVQLDPAGCAAPAVLRNTVGLPNLGVSRVEVAP